MKSCGNNHKDHDWGDDGRCRRCRARWKCPPHWFLVDNMKQGRCRFCPARKDYAVLQRKITYKDEMKQMKMVMMETKRGRELEREGNYPG